MRRVASYAELAPLFSALLKAGMESSAAPDRQALEREIAAGALYRENDGSGLLLLCAREGFWRMQFYLRRGAAPPAAELPAPTVLEMPYRGVVPAIARTWEERGFAPLLERVRLSRPSQPWAGPGESPVRLGKPEEERELSLLLRHCFPPLTGCLPTADELSAALREERVLVCPGGLLHFTRQGRLTEIRHLCVEEEARGRGLGKALVAGLLAREGEGRCRVWTGEKNQAALGLYRSFGFTEDGWRSQVRLFTKE